MRRRDFLAAAAVTLTAACSGTTSTAARPSSASPSASPTRSPSPSPSASPSPTAGTAAEIAARSTVPILCYHQVRPHTADDSANQRAFITPPKVLVEQLTAVRDAGYTSVGVTELVDHLEFGTPLPEKPVLLTFDDGSATHATTALPILQDLGQRATFFPMTVVLGKPPNWMTEDQVRQLEQAGMDIGAHTWDHQEVPTYSGDDWQTQLVEPKATLEEIVGHEIDIFAYPYGLWEPSAFSHVREAGFRAAFALQQDFAPDDPLLTIRRILVPPGLSGLQVVEAMGAQF